MRQIIGSAAEGDKFFVRKKIRERFFEELDNGNHIQVSAPRRVGKTSVLLDLQAQNNDKYYMVYVITESCKSGNEFFHRLLTYILDADTIGNYGKFNAKTRDFFKQAAGRFKSFSFKDFAVDLSGEANVDYFTELKHLLIDANLDGKQIVLMVDEFPITIENIKEEVSVEAATLFLKQCRELRQEPKLKNKLKFIYTGSIGLFSVVRAFNATSELNDLHEIKITQLTRPEAHSFTGKLLKGHELETDKPTVDYLLDKLNWLIPFHIQLLVKEVKDLHDLKPAEINKAFIDKAFKNVIKNGDMYFDHYRGRLGKVFPQEALKYIHELLSAMAEADEYPVADALDKATKYKLKDDFKTIINSLIYDGYIIETDDETAYQFYSPIIKAWWKRNG